MNSFKLIESHPIVEGILDDWYRVIGDDFDRYRNHVYRVFNYCMAFNGYAPADEANIAVAAVFHDIAIWSKSTFDYVEMSVDEMKEYIEAQGIGADMEVVAYLIRNHHKFMPYKGKHQEIVESFRKADLLDVSKGRARFGCKKDYIILAYEKFPYLRFHSMLKRMVVKNFLRNPFRPLPMLKW